MTTSGVSVFSVSMNDIIYGAFQTAEIIGAGDVLDAADYDIAKKDLNLMVKAWQTRGIGLWLNQQVTLPLAKDQQSYLLGPTGDHCSANLNKTAIATAAGSGSLTIEVDSVAAIDNGENIGIELDNGTMWWTTVNGVPVGTTVALAAALTDDVAVGNVVFSYANIITRPLEILDAVLQDKYGADMPLLLPPLLDYRQLPIKDNSGKVNQVSYDPQLVNGVLYIWPPSLEVSDVIVMTIKRPVQDFVNTADTPDFPVEWHDAIIKTLALQISPKFHVPTAKKSELAALAKQAVDDAEWYDREKTYLEFVNTPE